MSVTDFLIKGRKQLSGERLMFSNHTRTSGWPCAEKKNSKTIHVKHLTWIMDISVAETIKSLDKTK